MANMSCPGCDRAVSIEPEEVGLFFECSECGTKFRAGGSPPPVRRDETDDYETVHPGSGRPPSVLRVALAVVWGLLFLGVGGGALVFIGSVRAAQNYVHEAALGAMFSTIFIGAYIATRCLEKIANTFENKE